MTIVMCVREARVDAVNVTTFGGAPTWARGQTHFVAEGRGGLTISAATHEVINVGDLIHVDHRGTWRRDTPTSSQLASAILAERDRLDAVVHRLLGDACPLYVSGGYLEWLDELEAFADDHAPLPI